MTAPNAGAGRWPMSTDPLTEVLHAVAWPDGSTDGLPTYSVCRMLADAVLASDWLAAHDAQVRAEALEDAADELGPLVSAQHPATVNPDQWLRDRAVRIYEDGGR